MVIVNFSDKCPGPGREIHSRTYSFFFISWRLITLQYCSGFCHTLT